MYNSQEIANRIKERAKEKGIKLNDMLNKCGLSINTISKMSKGADIFTQNFAKIADFLNCSIDYLLGRTESPEIYSENNKILEYYNNMNHEGQERLINYASDLNKVDEYKKCNSSDDMKVG